jgi:hypothetical protein
MTTIADDIAMNHRLPTNSAFSPLWLLAVVVLTALLLVPLVFFGLDFTDTGYSTATAWMHTTHPQASDWIVNSFGTPLLAGLWFKATGNLSLLGFRLCWVLMMAGAMLAAYSIFVRLYEPRRVLIALVPTLILAVFNSEEGLIVEYHNLPPVLAVVSVACWWATFFVHSHRVPATLKRRLFAFASGLVAAVMVFSRLPMLAFVGYTLATLGLSVLWHEDRKQAVERSVMYVLGGTVGAAFLWLLLTSSGFSLEQVVQGSLRSAEATQRFNATADPALGYQSYTKSTIIRYGKIFGMGALAMASALVWQRFRTIANANGNRLGMVSMAHIGVLAAFAGLIVTMVFNDKAGFLGFHYGPMTSIMLGAPVLALVWMFAAQYTTLSLERKMLFTTALVLFVAASLGGSGVWVSTFRHGVWLVLPAMLLEAQRIATRVATERPQRLFLGQADMNFLRWLLVVGCITLGVALRVQMPYRDKPVYQHDAAFTHPLLVGIRSSAGRVRATEELLHTTRQLGIQPNDTIQAYPDGALLYLLTQTVAWYPDTWIGMQWADERALKEFVAAMPTNPLAGRRTLPKWVLRLKVDPNSAIALDAEQPTFGYAFGVGADSTALYRGFLNKPASAFLDSLWKAHGYTIAYENKGFVVLQR